MTDTYRGWTIDYDPPPIPLRGADWRAEHPDYEAWFDNGEWEDNDKKVHAATREALLAEIDAWIEENEHVS